MRNLFFMFLMMGGALVANEPETQEAAQPATENTQVSEAEKPAKTTASTEAAAPVPA